MSLLNEAGRFSATASHTQFGESSKGTPFVQITFTTDDGREITAWLYLSEKAFERSVQVLREVFAFDDNFDTLAGQVDGKRASIVTDVEEEQKDGRPTGKTRTVVRWINREGGGVPAPNPIANQAAFLRDMTRRARLLARTAGTPAPRPAASPKPAPASPALDEDVPF